MAEHYFPETAALQLLTEWERTGDIAAIDSLVCLLTPLVAKLVYARGVSVSMAPEDVQNVCLTRLATKLMRGKFDPARGTKLYSWVSKCTERAIIDSRRKEASYVNRMVPWDDYLSDRLHSNGAERAHEVICDLRERIMRIGTVLSGREKQAQQWLVLNLLQTDFVYQRWECSDSMSTVFGISPRRSRHIFDLTLLSVRRVLIGERKPPPVNIYRLCGTRQKALTRYRHRLSAEDFDRLVYLMVGLAPVILESGEYTLFEAIHGAPHKEQRLFPDGESSTLIGVSESAPITFQVEAFPSERQSHMPALAPSPSRSSSSPSSPSKYPALLQVEGLDDFNQNLRSLEGKAGRRFSLARAISSKANGNFAGCLETEVGLELQNVYSHSADGQTVLFPLSALDDGRRDLDSSSPLIETHVSREVLPFLRARSVASRLGAQTLVLGPGSLSIPRLSSTSDAFWTSETGIATIAAPTFSSVLLSPARITAITLISRFLLKMSSPDVTQLVISDISASISAAIDKAILVGSGVTPEPRGIMNLPVNATGVYDPAKRSPDITFGGAATFAKLNEFEATIDDGAQCHADGSFGWAGSPDTKAKLVNAPKVTGWPSYLWEQPVGTMDGTICGRTACSTSALGAGQLIFGRWSDAIIAVWGVGESQINEFSYASTNQIEVRTSLLCAIGFRRSSAFVTSTDSAAQ
jgi:HK97 family phage major capsid protein